MKNNNPMYYIFGANTDIGKTVFSCALSYTSIRKLKKTSYIKPIQTGLYENGDSLKVQEFVNSSLLNSRTIVTLNEPISPHRANNFNNTLPLYKNEFVISELKNELNSTDCEMVFIEGAGGIASPSLEKKLQCDLYREILLPIIFIGDSKLGGISTTISSIELAQSRGFKIVCLILFEGENENAEYFKSYFENQFPIIFFCNLNLDDNLKDWYLKEENKWNSVYEILLNDFANEHLMRNNALNVAKNSIWWPFTQHKNCIKTKFIHSAFKDDLYYETDNDTLPYYDASASWWTQGIGHASPKLMKAASYAAGRYGHVLFPGHVHEPVAKLTELLLNTVGKDWATRVFFSDNGSTANEVAIKMAFRMRFGSELKIRNPIILGLKDSYHGDTHATMDATNPNVFKKKEYWYNPKGHWLNYPKILFKNNSFHVEFKTKAQNISENLNISIENRKDIYSENRLNSNLFNEYKDYIDHEFQEIEFQNINIGACLLEGILLGSGGMKFVDPIFQKLLIQECQKRKIPVILDEVFTGFWRLGYMSAAKLLGVNPDIACYGKLLTGGLLPLSVTLAKEEVFEKFYDNKLENALLHGHSYTAHPIGCYVSIAALQETIESKFFNSQSQEMEIEWDKELICNISNLNCVEGIVLLGTVFALTLKSDNPGYTSNQSQEIVKFLFENYIYARPLGNVIYFMSGFNTSKEQLKTILSHVYNCLVKAE